MSEYFTDGVHLNAVGAQAIAGPVRRLVEAAGADLIVSDSNLAIFERGEEVRGLRVQLLGVWDRWAASNRNSFVFRLIYVDRIWLHKASETRSESIRLWFSFSRLTMGALTLTE